MLKTGCCRPDGTDRIRQRGMQWIESMEGQLNSYEGVKPLINDLSQGNGLAAAVLGSTNSVGSLGVTRASIFVDLAQFDRKGIVKLSNELEERAQIGRGGDLGLSEIAIQNFKATEAAVKLRHLSASAEDAEIVRRLVEMSIKFHPRRAELGGAIDELQLIRGVGINWIRLKDNCKKQE